MRLLVLVFGLALVGCAGRPSVEAEPRLVRVEVPVAVPCRTEEVAVPSWAVDSLRKGDTLELKVRALLAERLQRIGYERELLAANRACR